MQRLIYTVTSPRLAFAPIFVSYFCFSPLLPFVFPLPRSALLIYSLFSRFGHERVLTNAGTFAAVCGDSKRANWMPDERSAPRRPVDLLSLARRSLFFPSSNKTESIATEITNIINENETPKERNEAKRKGRQTTASVLGFARSA